MDQGGIEHPPPKSAVWIWDLGFRILNFGFGIWDCGFRIFNVGFGILDLQSLPKFGFCIRYTRPMLTRVGGYTQRAV